MDRRTDIIHKLKRFKREVGKEFPLSQLIFFGSIAEGKGRKDSDIDLVLVSKNFNQFNFLKRASKMYDYWNIKMPVDFLCYTPEEFEKLRKQVSIVSHALKYGIVV